MKISFTPLLQPQKTITINIEVIITVIKHLDLSGIIVIYGKLGIR
jgi:hypothetical protein